MDYIERLETGLSERYTIAHEIGRGGMARVYLAEDLKHNRKVAVKVLRQEISATLGGGRFFREIKTLAGLQHPHIVPLYDSGEAGGLFFYVMPFVEDETLRERLLRERQLTLEDALHVVHDVAEALDYAHAAGVVHRDIKPENILLSRDHALVSDFGISRAVESAGGEEFTSSGLAVGTAAYMAPEQGTASRDIDGRTDVYALGCVLFEMLVGEPPFTGPTPQAMIARHISEPPPSVRVVRPAVPSEVEQAINKALAKVPADRFPTAAEFRKALARTHTRSADRRSRPVFPTSRVTVGAALILVVALLWLVRSALPFGGEPSGGPRLLVLPLVDPRASSLDREFAVALHEHLVTFLDDVTTLEIVDGIAISGSPSHSRSDLAKALEQAGDVDARYMIATEVTKGVNRQVSLTLKKVSTGETIVRGIASDSLETLEDGAARLGLRALVSLREREEIDVGPIARLAKLTSSPTAARNLEQGLRLFNKRDVDGAASLFRQAVEADSNFAEAYFWLASVETWGSRWDYSTALDVVESGLAHAKAFTEPRAQLLRALRHYVLRRSDSSIAGFQDVVRDNPEIVEGWFGLGEALYHFAGFAGHERDNSRVFFERLVRLDTSFAAVYSHLAELALRGNDRERATEYVRRSAADERNSLLYRLAFDLRFGAKDRSRQIIDSLAAADFRTLAFLVIHFVQSGDHLDVADTIAGIFLDPSRTREERVRGAQYRLLVRAVQGRWPSGLATWKDVASGTEFDRWIVQASFCDSAAVTDARPSLQWARAAVDRGDAPDFSLRINDVLRQAFRGLAHAAVLGGDSLETAALLQRIRDARRSAARTDPFPEVLEAALLSRLALLASDTTEAVRLLKISTARVAEPYLANYPLVAMAPERLLLAELYGNRGESRRALQWAQSFGETPSIGDSFCKRRAGQLAERYLTDPSQEK